MLGEAAIDLMAAVWLREGHATNWTRYCRDAEEISRKSRFPVVRRMELVSGVL